jgi:Zn-dependent alcohol dehydrogenase
MQMTAAAIKISDDVPFEGATILGCAVVNGVGAALRQGLQPHV